MHKFILCFLILFTASQVSLRAQICTGNLGANIFTDGDFGSGTANFNFSFQNIAPGYSFTSDPPPGDGWFIVTKSTAWANAYTTWLQIGDNSNDPNGYMMVVNASFEPGLFYDQVIDGLCENTLYEFSADVINMIRSNVSDHIAPNISFQLDGVSIISSGDIPQDEEWHQYGVLFTTNPGQTSVRLSIRNNAPGGNGNDLALDNISFRACGDEALILPRDIENICEDGNPIDLNATIVGTQYPNPAIQWQRSLDGGITWENIPGATGLTIQHTDLSSGYYHYRYLLANDANNLLNSKCRVISNIKIVYVQPKIWPTIDTVCAGIDYFFNGRLLNQSGFYSDSLKSAFGCDSIVTLDLTITPDPDIEAVLTAKDPNCIEPASGEINIESILRGTPPFRIFIDGEFVGDDTFFPALTTGTYNFEIRDRYGCSVSELIELVPPDAFSVDIGEDLSLILGNSAMITATASQSVQTYTWLPPEVTDCTDCSSFEFIPGENTTLILEATSEQGCTAADTLNIEVAFEKLYYIPSAFSPNNDGINDGLTVYASVPNVTAVRNFRVFDRWGNLLFEKETLLPNDQEEGWKGNFSGKPLDPGVYTYMATIEFLNGQTEVVGGDVTLVR